MAKAPEGGAFGGGVSRCPVGPEPSFPVAFGTIVSVTYTTSCLCGGSPFGPDGLNALGWTGTPCLGLEPPRIIRTPIPSAPGLQLATSSQLRPACPGRPGQAWGALSLGFCPPAGRLPGAGGCEQAQASASRSLAEASTTLAAGAWPHAAFRGLTALNTGRKWGVGGRPRGAGTEGLACSPRPGAGPRRPWTLAPGSLCQLFYFRRLLLGWGILSQPWEPKKARAGVAAPGHPSSATRPSGARCGGPRLARWPCPHGERSHRLKPVCCPWTFSHRNNS